MTSYDAWKTDPDIDYAGHRTYDTAEEEDMLDELRDLRQKRRDLELDLEDVNEMIDDIERKLGL